jgi:hypothetical protein
MADLVYESGKLTPVYYNVGLRSTDRSLKLMRAAFDVLQWASTSGGRVETYAVPLGFERVTAKDVNDPLADDNREAIDVGQEFGFYGTTSHVIETNDGNGGNNFFGVHSFGLL